MEVKMDLSKTYAVTLEGGGAKGAYQVGAWKALEEAGFKYNAVSGSSVGALNGAMMCMRDLAKAEALWSDIRFSNVMDVDDSVMKRLFIGDYYGISPKLLSQKILSVFRKGGFDVTPLRNLLAEVVDEDRVRNSDVDFFLVTYSKTDKKELDLDARKLGEGEILNMLLASAYFPAFRHEMLDGKSYTDGGVKDVFPINSLLSRGYRNIIAIRIFGVGIEKRVKIPKDANIITIAPRQKLGSVLNFGKAQSQRNMTLGYYDAKRAIYGLYGKTYYIDRNWSEKQAYILLEKLVFHYYRDASQQPTLRQVNEEYIPRLAMQCGGKGDYYDILVAFMEAAAAKLGIYEFEIYQDRKLWKKIFDEASKPHSKIFAGVLKYIIH